MELFDKKFVYLEWDDVLKDKEVFVADSLPELRGIVNNNSSNRSGHVSDSGIHFPFRFYGLNYTMAYYDPNYSCKRAYMEGKMIQASTKTFSDPWIDCTGEPKWSDTCKYRVKPDNEMWTACIDDEGIVSVMPACAWNKDKGRQLIEGTEEECKDYAVENYCSRCVRKANCAFHQWFICNGQTLDTAPKIYAWYCQGFRELKTIKKRRKTNRELAKWIMQGNGQMKQRDGKYIHNTFNVYDVHDDDTPCPDYLVIRGWDETEWHEPEVEE